MNFIHLEKKEYCDFAVKFKCLKEKNSPRWVFGLFLGCFQYQHWVGPSAADMYS